MASKTKAKDDSITQKAEGDDKEFASDKMAVEGTKAADDSAGPPVHQSTAPKHLTIGDLLPDLRKKGMKI